MPLTQCVQDPVVLLVSVVILSGPESVSHVLHTVHYRAGKVIGWVHSEKLQQIKHLKLYTGKHSPVLISTLLMALSEGELKIYVNLTFYHTYKIWANIRQHKTVCTCERAKISTLYIGCPNCILFKARSNWWFEYLKAVQISHKYLFHFLKISTLNHT